MILLKLGRKIAERFLDFFVSIMSFYRTDLTINAEYLFMCIVIQQAYAYVSIKPVCLPN